MYGHHGKVKIALRRWERTVVKMSLRGDGDESSIALDVYPRRATPDTPRMGATTFEFETDAELCLPRASVWRKAMTVVKLGERGLTNVARFIVWLVRNVATEFRARMTRFVPHTLTHS